MPKCYVNVCSHPYKESKKQSLNVNKYQINVTNLSPYMNSHTKKIINLVWNQYDQFDFFCQINMAESTKPWSFWPTFYLFIYLFSSIP
jgi:hypothetical protein